MFHSPLVIIKVTYLPQMFFSESWNTVPGGGMKVKCRVVYASRTHSQLSQVIQEFRRSPYNHVSSVILASRDQLCINEQLATASDKTQMCKAKVKTRSCEYYNNIERVRNVDICVISKSILY